MFGQGTRSSTVIAVAIVAALGASVALPTNAATTSTIFSGKKAYEPINIEWAKVDGVLINKAHGNGPLGVLEFRTINNPKSLTFAGDNVQLDIAQEIRIEDFEGRYSITEGNVKFDGVALGWAICNRDSDADLLEDCLEVFVHLTDPFDADTDDGGLGDGEEVLLRELDPLDPSDDHLSFSYSQTGPNGERLAPLRIEWLTVNGQFVTPGNFADYQLTGDLLTEAICEEWIYINGENLELSPGDTLLLDDFNGTVETGQLPDGTDVLRFVGHMESIAINLDPGAGQPVHLAGRITSEGPAGRPQLLVHLLAETTDKVLLEEHETITLPSEAPTPIYERFSLWTRADPEHLGTWTLRLLPTTHHGASGAWLEMTNPEMGRLLKFLPVPAPLPVPGPLCAVGPPPAAC